MIGGVGVERIVRNGERKAPVVRFRVLDVAAGESLDSLLDRKSTRLNSSHSQISYAVF